MRRSSSACARSVDCVLFDLSSNGHTYVNGEQVCFAHLDLGDDIRLGSTVYTLRVKSKRGLTRSSRNNARSSRARSKRSGTRGEASEDSMDYKDTRRPRLVAQSKSDETELSEEQSVSRSVENLPSMRNYAFPSYSSHSELDPKTVTGFLHDMGITAPVKDNVETPREPGEKTKPADDKDDDGQVRIPDTSLLPEPRMTEASRARGEQLRRLRETDRQVAYRKLREEKAREQRNKRDREHKTAASADAAALVTGRRKQPSLRDSR